MKRVHLPTLVENARNRIENSSEMRTRIFNAKMKRIKRIFRVQ